MSDVEAKCTENRFTDHLDWISQFIFDPAIPQKVQFFIDAGLYLGGVLAESWDRYEHITILNVRSGSLSDVRAVQAIVREASGIEVHGYRFVSIPQ